MIRCSNCGAEYFEGTLFCDECGTTLKADLLANEKQTDPLRGAPVFRENVSGTAPMGSSTSSDVPHSEIQIPPGTLVLWIANSQRRQFFEMDKEILIGRLDSANRVFPDLDLTADGGFEGGVSRRHSRVTFRDGVPYVEDLKSTNHTYLNDVRLDPLTPHPLRHGDELRLGSTLLRVELPPTEE